MELNISDWVLVITTLFLGIIALIAPTVSEYIKRWFFAPKITLSFEEAPPYCLKTFLRTPLLPDLNEPVYYFRFKIENTGKSQLKQCEAVLEQLWIYNAAGKPEKLPGFLSSNLKWADTQDLIILENKPFPVPRTYIDLSPHRSQFCNIGHLSSLKYQKEIESQIFMDIPGTHKSKSRFLFDQLFYPNSQPNCLLPGKYGIKISLYSENSPIKESFFQIAWSGNWQDNETEMFRELTINTIEKI